MHARRLGLFGFVAIGMAATAWGCSGAEQGRGHVAEEREESSGSVGLSLVTGGTTINSLSYVITGPSGFSRSAQVDISKSASPSFLVSGLPIGSGYSVSVTASSVDGGTSCSGSTTFAVAARATAKVTLKLQCREPAKTGGALVNGQLNVCPLIDGLDASPAEALIGAPMQLSAGAHDGDAGPSALSYQWTATSGNLSNATSAKPTLTCTAAGPVTVKLVVSDGDCGDTLEATLDCTAPIDPIATVAATVETTPVPDTGDAADDPAIWVNATSPAQSVIIGTDKQAGGGLGVYGLDGHQIQYVPFGKLNNVDLRDGFPLGGSNVTLVTAGNRTDNTIAIFALDPVTRLLRDVAARKITTLTTYGSCMYKSSISGKFYYFVDAKDGNTEQWELQTVGDKVDAVKVRSLHQLSSQPEACAVDDEAKAIFIGEEAKGVWRFDAEPSVTSGPGWEGVLIASTDPGGHLVRDVEGVAIAKTSATAGYIFVSNQGVDTYSVFTREAPYSYVKTFKVARGEACVDDVTGSDGIEVNAANLGPAFPHGVFVTQDDFNEGENQNFKLVPLEHILGTPPVVDDHLCGAGGTGGASSGGTGGASAGGSAGSGGSAGAIVVGYGEPFCTTYCDKCASCYATGAFSEGDCVYHQPKTAFTVEDCKAGCAVSATPGAVAKASLPAGFENLTCTAFDDSI